MSLSVDRQNHSSEGLICPIPLPPSSHHATPPRNTSLYPLPPKTRTPRPPNRQHNPPHPPRNLAPSPPNLTPPRRSPAQTIPHGNLEPPNLLPPLHHLHLRPPPHARKRPLRHRCRPDRFQKRWCRVSGTAHDAARFGGYE